MSYFGERNKNIRNKSLSLAVGGKRFGRIKIRSTKKQI